MRQGSRLSFSSKPGHPMRRRLLFKDYQTIIRFEQQAAAHGVARL
jgi:hypothetical protein